MALTHDTISNFIGGVSQQPDKLMFPNQAKELINMIPNPSVGLTRRFPTEHIKKLMNPLTKHPKTHTVVKENEQYKIYLTGDDIKVFDLSGNEKTVHYGDKVYEVLHNTTKCYTSVAGASGDHVVANTKLYTDYKLVTEYTLGDGEAVTDFTYNGVDEPAEQKAELTPYITTLNPLSDLDATTIGDYNFILNKTVVAKLQDDLYPSVYRNAALIFVKQGDYAIDYVIKVNGTQVASKTTSDTAISDCKTNSIATALYNGLNTNLGSTDWDIIIQNSTILLERKDGAEFTIQTSDSNADRNLYSFYKETDDLQNLPVVAPDGFIIKIIGEDVNTSDDYYVEFHTADGSAFGTGSWQECPSPDCKYRLDVATMPHALVREADSSFTFKTIEWTDRRAGDEDSAKTPSFVDNTIQEIFTHKGRIAFVSSDKSIYSDTEDVFAFFKKTTLTKLDTDPVDISSNSKMVLLKHSLPFNNDLLLFSDTSQFTVTCGDVFSNSTVSIDLTMEYPCSALCKPVNIGGTGLFVHDNGNYSGVYEAYIASTYNTAARSITEQIPSYIPNHVYKIAPSVLHNIALFPTVEDRTSVYVYNAYYSSEQKAQSSWSKWEFKDREILNLDFIENYLYITAQYADGVYLERMNFTANQKENSNLNYILYLDRKAVLSNGTYDSTTNKTAYTLPYPVTTTTQYEAVSKNGFSKPFTISGNTIYIKGNTTEDTITFGKLFTSYWKMNNIYKRQQTSTGAYQVTEGLLMLKDIRLSYTDSCYFKARVVPFFNTQITSEYEYTGIITGTISATLGQRNAYSGVFTIPVLAKNDEIEIEIINDSFLPSNFLSLEWLGDLCIRGNNN